MVVTFVSIEVWSAGEELRLEGEGGWLGGGVAGGWGWGVAWKWGGCWVGRHEKAWGEVGDGRGGL